LVVDVFAQRGGGVTDLSVDREVDEVFQLLLAEPSADEAELERRLLAALGEVVLVEREPEFAVFEDEVLSRVVISAARKVHIEAGSRWGPGSSGSYVRLLLSRLPCMGFCTPCSPASAYTLLADGTPLAAPSASIGPGV